MDRFFSYLGDHPKGSFLVVSIILTTISVMFQFGWEIIAFCSSLSFLGAIVFFGWERGFAEFVRKIFGNLFEGLFKIMSGEHGITPACVVDGGIMFLVGLYMGDGDGVNVAATGAMIVITGLVSIPVKSIYFKKN